MLTKRCTLYCQEQLKSGFPGWVNFSWLVCPLDFPQVEAVRFGTDPREDNSRKRNSHFEKSLTDLPNLTLPETWAVVSHLMAPCSDLPLLLFQHHTACSALSLQETDTGAGPDLWLVNQLWQLPAAFQRERCCDVWLQWGCSSRVREFLAAVLCFSLLPRDGMCDPVWALTWWIRTNWKNLVYFLY